MAWRERYEPEMRALLEQSQISLATLLDLLAGALDAHIHPAVPVAAGHRMRSSVVMALYCWIAFAVVGAGFAKATEDQPFRAAGAAHGLLGAARIAVLVLALSGAAVVVAAGAPIALRVLRQAYSGDRALRRALLMICAAIAVVALATAGLVALAHSTHGNAGVAGHVASLAWLAIGVLGAAVCGWSARKAIFSAELEWIELRAGTAGARLLALIMMALTVAVGLYAIALATVAPGVAALSNGPLQVGTTSVLVAQAVVMALISALAVVTAWRGRLDLAR